MTHVKAGQRRRAKAPKVRTGCRTCKIRKVKCDEGQPACKRCTSTGRNCDGYDVQALAKVPQFITTLPGHYQEQEVRAFQFFHERTLAQLAVFSDNDFWNSTVPRIAHSERGIWHSVVALSAYHEHYLSSIQPVHDHQDKFALRHYNLSIKRILGPNQTATDAHVHIISCILFMCIEVLRGNTLAVIGLLKGGYSILQEARSSRYKLSNEQGASDSIDALYSQAHIFFVRLASQLHTLVGKIDPVIAVIADEIIRETSVDRLKHKKLQSLHEAAADLSSIRMEFERFDPRCIPTVSTKLAAWSAALDEYLTTNASHLTSATSKRTVALLDLRKQYFEIDLDVHSSGDATDILKWDRHCDKFNDMIKLAEVVMDVSDLPPQLASGPQFHMQTGAVPILYGIACKCRHPTIRRKAASLLTARPRLEGVWNNATVSRVAFQAMVTEERGLPAQSCMDIPADSRIRGIKVAMGANRQYMVGYMTSQGCFWEQAGKYGITQ